MNLGKYIHELLLENDLVIIPGFGAFISNYKPAEIKPETNIINPPSKEVSFNRQIRNNDGLLVGSVAQGEAVSHFDALKLIENEREDMLYNLDKGEKVILDETGELLVTKSGEIEFHPFKNENLLLDSFGLDAIVLEKPVKTEPEEIVENPEEKTPPRAEPVIVREKEVVKEPALDPEKEERQPELVPYFDEKEEPEKEGQKRRGWLWLLLIIVPIVGIGFYLLNKQRGEHQPPVESMDNTITIIKEEDPVSKPGPVLPDSVAIAGADSVIAEKPEISPTGTHVLETPKFYLVGGSFKEKGNANNYLIELKNRGFEPFLLGKRGNFYIIGIGKYNSEREALRAKQKFTEQNPKSGVWVMEEKRANE